MALSAGNCTRVHGWWYDRLQGKKTEKDTGQLGWGWTFVGITGPIEAGFNKDANLINTPWS